MAEQKDPDEEKRILGDVADARTARSRFAGVYNDFFDLAAPEKQRVGDEKNTTPKDPGTQDNIFDNTLQEAVADYASSFSNEFTPAYRAWTKHQASEVVDPRFRDELEKQINARKKLTYDTIRQSSFQEASQEAYVDSAIGPCAVAIRHTRAGRPIDVEYIPLSGLLILPGPFGGVGHRYWERQVRVRDLDTVYDFVDWSHVKPTRGMRREAKGSVTVIEGGYRDWTKETETWRWFVVHGGKVRWSTTYTGRGSCPFQVGRISVSHPSAYGANPGIRALAPARTLNEIAYLELKRAGKIVDPPGAYIDPAGLFNPNQGLDAGLWYEAGEGFAKFDMGPTTDMREVFLKHEELRMAVLRALFQDKPYQRGQTPPSATQWAGEQAMAEERKTLPRERMYREWTLPIVQRFEHIMEKRGELAPVQVDDRIIDVRPVSPLSKAADLEDAQLGFQLLDGIVAANMNPAEVIDQLETVKNLQAKLGDEVVKVLTADEREAQLQRQLGAADKSTASLAVS